MIAAARGLAIEGVNLAQDGHCEQAIPKLERAEELHHGPIVLAQLGECYVEVGRLVEGAEALRSVLREAPPENASPAMRRAYSNAHVTLDATKSKIAMLTISLDAVSEADAKITVDGKALPPALIGVARPTDPGVREIEASAPGFLPTKRKLTVEPGASEKIELALVLDPAAPRARPVAAAVSGRSNSAAAVEAPVRAAPPVRSSAAPNHLPAYVAWGVGVAAIGVGIGFGLVAMDQKAALDDACPAQSCPWAQSAKLDAAQDNGVISTLGFGVGLGAALVGGALFFLAGDDERMTAQPGSTSRPRTSARVGLAGADVSVQF